LVRVSRRVTAFLPPKEGLHLVNNFTFLKTLPPNRRGKRGKRSIKKLLKSSKMIQELLSQFNPLFLL